MDPELLMVVNNTGAVGIPLHNTWLEGWFICPAGFTVIVKVCGVPEQELPPLMNTGVTVIVLINGVVPVLIA